MRSEEQAAGRIALVGPTAAGKTAVGIELARQWNAEIVNADSMQVYRHMDIGTAKPTPAEQTEAKFHGIDLVDPDAEWTLADYQAFGEAACQTLQSAGRTPLIVGGTGLYVRALTTRLDIPTAPPDEAFRAQWRAIAEERGTEYVQNELAQVDPAAATRIHVNDLKRLIRALEVFHTQGIPMSELHARNQAAPSDLGEITLFGLHFADRETLYQRIESRIDAMLAAGFLDEVRGLLSAGYGRGLKPMQSLGYRHLCAYLAGEWDWETTVAMLKQDTRRYAKRQLIWFRADPRIQWVSADDKTPTQLAEEIAALLPSISITQQMEGL